MQRNGSRDGIHATIVASLALIARLVLIPALPAGVLGAQAGVAVLTGRIVDTAGAPVIGASVRIPQLERSVAVDSSGRYRVEGLPTGRMTIIGEAPGFAGKRADVVIPTNGTVEQAFALVPNAHVLANVEVRARARQQLPLRLHEFEQRRTRGTGRFPGPDDLVKFNGRPLMDALKTVMVGARFQRAVTGEMVIVSSRMLNPGPLRIAQNIKPCGIQIWEDGALLSDPNQSLEVMLPRRPNVGNGLGISTLRVGADHDYDISHLLTNNYAAVEYYTDLASTPPGFRTGTPSCGTLVLWTRFPSDGSDAKSASAPARSP